MTPLEAEIRRIIETDGPISVADYMRLCLGHPQHGYYVTRDPLGSRGDFITAPEVSQMFGELIGAWAATVWQQMGARDDVRLIELGPGRGTLMADALRAAKGAPEFLAAVSVHLVETSPVLRAAQAAVLAGANCPVAWHAQIEDVPEGPCITVANEFVDALPVDQFVNDRGWHMRMIGIVDSRLAFVVSPDALPRRTEIEAPPGAILESRQDRPIAILARRIARHGGAALIIDYGHGTTGFGDTLQAVHRHTFADPLAAPGEVDLTTQVDFVALARTARREGAQVHGPVTQGDFLRRLGIEARTARLKVSATPQQMTDIDAALARLTAGDQMGELFKVLAIAHPALGTLPGFESSAP
jgi:NADH dehydrogenase [ubiquinone] 1 alpha subcomplex assembly factor 7